MIAKLIVHDTDRSAAIKKARDALSRFYYSGVKTTIPFYKKLLHHDGFLKNKIHTRWIEEELMNEDMGK
jgi:acetyl-CoA carboxylase biotin carboxylase subunit